MFISTHSSRRATTQTMFSSTHSSRRATTQTMFSSTHSSRRATTQTMFSSTHSSRRATTQQCMYECSQKWHSYSELGQLKHFVTILCWVPTCSIGSETVEGTIATTLDTLPRNNSISSSWLSCLVTMIHLCKKVKKPCWSLRESNVFAWNDRSFGVVDILFAQGNGWLFVFINVIV